MGNSMCGQRPSLTLQLIMDMMQKRIDIVYDAETLKKISKLEMAYFEQTGKGLQYQRENLDVLYSVVEKKFPLREIAQKLSDALVEYTKESKYSMEDDTNTDSETKPEEKINEINVEVYLLDIVYGRKQCEYAIDLLRKADAICALNPGCDALKVIEALYSVDKENNLVLHMRQEVISEVVPDSGAQNIWCQWSLL